MKILPLVLCLFVLSSCKTYVMRDVRASLVADNPPQAAERLIRCAEDEDNYDKEKCLKKLDVIAKSGKPASDYLRDEYHKEYQESNNTLVKINLASEVPLNYDTVWRKVVQAIALEGIEISTNDKDSGIIQGSKSSDENSKYFVCPPLKGRAKSYSFNLTATVSEKTETSSIVSVRGEGLRKSYQNRHFIVITTGRKHTETKCETTGELESILFNRISQH